MLIQRHQKVYGNTSWQYGSTRDEPALDNNGNIIDFPANDNNSKSFKFKQQITGKQETVAQKMLK